MEWCHKGWCGMLILYSSSSSSSSSSSFYSYYFSHFSSSSSLFISLYSHLSLTVIMTMLVWWMR